MVSLRLNGLLDHQICRSDPGYELAESERRRTVRTDDINVGFGRDLIFHADCPVAGVDQQPAQPLALEILRSAHGCGEYPDGTILSGMRASPRDRHHRIVRLAANGL